MMRRMTMLATIAAAAVLLAACSDGGSEDETSTGTAPQTSSAAPTAEETTTDGSSEEPTSSQPEDDATGPAFPTTTEEQSSDQTDAALLLVDVRVAEHEGFDRLVLEFEGDGEPGYQVGYVDEASTEGKGDPITLDSDALLRVAALHTMPDDMSGYYDGPQIIDADAEVIDEVFVDGTFEGQTVVIVGVDDPGQVFRVFTLTDPTRLVVDVADDES